MSSALPYQMPDPREIPALVGTLHGNAEKGGHLLADALKPDLNALLTSGDAMTELLTVDEKLNRPADADEDNVFGGTGEILSGTVRVLTTRGLTPLTDAQKKVADLAVKLQKHWIGDNTRFLTLKYSEEWRECNDRVRLLDKPMPDSQETPRQAFSALGLDWAVERMEAVHATYGRVLGFAGLDDSGLKKLAAWEKALKRFLSGLGYHHSDDAEIQSLFFAPYQNAIEEGRARRRR